MKVPLGRDLGFYTLLLFSLFTEPLFAGRTLIQTLPVPNSGIDYQIQFFVQNLSPSAQTVTVTVTAQGSVTLKPNAVQMGTTVTCAADKKSCTTVDAFKAIAGGVALPYSIVLTAPVDPPTDVGAKMKFEIEEDRGAVQVYGAVFVDGGLFGPLIFQPNGGRPF